MNSSVALPHHWCGIVHPDQSTPTTTWCNHPQFQLHVADCMLSSCLEQQQISSSAGWDLMNATCISFELDGNIPCHVSDSVLFSDCQLVRCEWLPCGNFGLLIKTLFFLKQGHAVSRTCAEIRLQSLSQPVELGCESMLQMLGLPH